MRDVERAVLTFFAMHNPEGLWQHEEQLFAQASSDDRDEEIAQRARRLIDRIRTEGVLDDGPRPESERGSGPEHGEDSSESSPVDDGGP